MVAMALLELVHIPPEDGSIDVVFPTQILEGPVRVITGLGKTVIFWDGFE